jgi:DNA-binding NtrC family response regulator
MIGTHDCDRLLANRLKIVTLASRPELLGRIGSVLGGLGLHCRSFLEARHALEAIAADPPDLLIAEVPMPGGEALGLIAQVSRRRPGIGIVALAAPAPRQSPLSPHPSLWASADRVLPLPLDLARLLGTVASLLERAHRPAAAAPGPGRAATASPSAAARLRPARKPRLAAVADS